MQSSPYKALSIISILAVFVVVIVYLFNLDQRLQRLESNQDGGEVASAAIEYANMKTQELNKTTTEHPAAGRSNKYLNAATETPGGKRIYGDPNARITLMMFSDLDCPFCKKMHSSMKSIVDGAEGSVNWEFKHFPLPMHNPSAFDKAMLAECAAKTNSNRTAWEIIEELVSGTPLLGLAPGEAGLCLKNRETKDIVLADVKFGSGLGITTTPVIVVIDNKTGKKGMLKGYKKTEHILQGVQAVMGI